ncbi:MAG: aspartate-semialdehyde dehydrogenase [Planctomycetes bacterium]|nr:aspartate-semialdehyde dehydrogenase [Planctomycetota bacterium]
MSLPDNPNIAIVGATGAVGREFLPILRERGFSHGSLRLLASSRSAGSTIEHDGNSHTVQELTPSSFEGIDLALFSAGASISKEYAPIAVKQGTTVIDNSSCFRMDENVPLIVPEINRKALDNFSLPGIVAVPNCSAIVALMAITPLHRAVGVERMVISTYQAASGAGAAWMAELEQQAHDFAEGRPYTTKVLGRQYLFNLFSHNSPMGSDGSNEEERKIIQETHKIWADDSVRISVTCIRVAVLRAHCASINLTFRGKLEEDKAREILQSAPGVKVVDDREANKFPEPIDAAGQDDILVGRIRNDNSQPAGKGLNLFVAGDQLRKGAALNAVQIAECLVA